MAPLHKEPAPLPIEMSPRCISSRGRGTKGRNPEMRPNPTTRPPNCACIQCGVAMYLRPWEQGRRRYCSMPCRYAWEHAHRPSPEERFWSWMDKSDEDGCWPWMRGRDLDGYGIFSHTHDIPARRANRVAWELTNGPIPAGLEVCHTCDNPPCCRPDHLFLATNAGNHADRDRKGRQARGERNGWAKLTADAVRAIRASGEPARILVERFGVKKATISSVRTGRSWKHIA